MRIMVDYDALRMPKWLSDCFQQYCNYHSRDWCPIAHYTKVYGYPTVDGNGDGAFLYQRYRRSTSFTEYEENGGGLGWYLTYHSHDYGDMLLVDFKRLLSMLYREG